jgi:hypothetical protein
LPAPEGPDHRHRRARRDVEIDALQDLAIGIIGERDILEADMARRHHQRRRAGRIDDFGRVSIRSNIAAHVDHALADRAIDPAEHVERAEQLAEQVETSTTSPAVNLPELQP